MRRLAVHSNLFAEELLDSSLAWKAKWRAHYQAAWNRTNALTSFSDIYSIANAEIRDIEFTSKHNLLHLIELITTRSILCQFFWRAWH